MFIKVMLNVLKISVAVLTLVITLILNCNANANAKVSSNITYSPYIQADVARYFGANEPSFNLTKIDIFMPVWQKPDQLLYFDLRSYIPTAYDYKGNFHLGYRKLFEDEQRLYGIYSSFDMEKPSSIQYLKQVTFGLEAWLADWFVGANYYQPVRTKVFLNNPNVSGEDLEYTKAMAGVDLEIGKKITRKTTIYFGGYYFDASHLKPIYGPKISLDFEGDLDKNNSFLSIFDMIGIHLDFRYDNPRGFYFALGMKFRTAPLLEQLPLSDFATHMLDSMRREIDIISGKYYESGVVSSASTGKKSFNIPDILPNKEVTEENSSSTSMPAPSSSPEPKPGGSSIVVTYEGEITPAPSPTPIAKSDQKTEPTPTPDPRKKKIAAKKAQRRTMAHSGDR